MFLHFWTGGIETTAVRWLRLGNFRSVTVQCDKCHGHGPSDIIRDAGNCTFYSFILVQAVLIYTVLLSRRQTNAAQMLNLNRLGAGNTPCHTTNGISGQLDPTVSIPWRNSETKAPKSTLNFIPIDDNIHCQPADPLLFLRSQAFRRWTLDK